MTKDKKGSGFPNGQYDKHGRWQKYKHCFVYCGPDRCDCGPPNGIYQIDPPEVKESTIRPQLLEDINNYYNEEE